MKKKLKKKTKLRHKSFDFAENSFWMIYCFIFFKAVLNFGIIVQKRDKLISIT